MLALRKHLDDGVVYPSDFELLQRVFDEACAERHIDPRSDEAEFLALRTVVLFQQGITDETEIKARLAVEP